MDIRMTKSIPQLRVRWVAGRVLMNPQIPGSPQGDVPQLVVQFTAEERSKVAAPARLKLMKKLRKLIEIRN